MSNILVQSRTFSQKMKTVFVPTAIAMLLAACSGKNMSDTLKDEAYANSEFYINKIEQTSKQEDKQTYRLLAVRKLIEENKSFEAQNTFAEISTEKFDEQQVLEYQLLNAQLLALQGQNVQASTALRQLPQATLSQSQYLRFYQTQAKVAENQKDVLEAVKARALMDNYLTDNKVRQENNDHIWSLLRNANRGTINRASADNESIAYAGWLALIKAYNQNMSNPAFLPQALENWKQEYPNHSANTLMPEELKKVVGFRQTQLNGVALLLPLSGDASVIGEMVKRGFDDARGGDESIPVQIYDTDTASVEELIIQAKADGAQTIIGPLLKSRVDEALSSRQIANVNLLALNTASTNRTINGVCYYALSPEGEARAAAERFLKDGVSHAVVAAPQGEAGQRAADAFVQRWRELTRKDADVRYYNDALETIDSLQNSGMGSGSALYVLGSADDLLDIKQGIDTSSLANRFPIYASSRGNVPSDNTEYRSALEGVKFSEIPLLADVDSEEYKKAEALSSSDFAMMRLYAMGADAWTIANKFNEFRQIPGYRISGLTGVLSSSLNCNIERQLTWLQYRGGEIMSAH